MPEKKYPAPPEVLEERDRVVTRFENSEIIQTRDGITIQERCRSRLDSESTVGLSKPLPAQPSAQPQEQDR